MPDALKIAKVIHVFKNGSKTKVENFRPISILPSFSKIVEKAIYNRLLSFLNKNNSLFYNQFGFRAQYSTYMALLEFQDKITESIKTKNVTASIFIDLQKAFDTIDHSILCHKLDQYGIRGVANDLLSNYLFNRKQFVQIDNTISSMQNINCGVPQGSILGPLLFLIYINNLQNCSDFLYAILFADDTTLIASAKTFELLVFKLNQELGRLTSWLSANKLSINVKKSNYMIFGNRNKMNENLKICLNCDELTR